MVSNVVINDTIPDSNVGVADDLSYSWTHFPSFDVMCAPNFIWGDVPGETFTHSVTAVMMKLFIGGNFCLKFH